MSRTQRVLKWIFGVAFASLAFAASGKAATITVNGAGDTSADDGTCTLREAITAANTDTQSGATLGECASGAGADVIIVNIAGAAVHTITPGSALPTITGGPVEIDGSNVGGGPIQIDATGYAAGTAGLITSTGADGSSFHDFAIVNAPDDGIRALVPNNTIDHVRLGVTLSGGGVAAGNGGDGILVRASGTTVRDSTISNNGSNGIVVESSLASVNNVTIAGNVIGANPAGTAAMPNVADGIAVNGGFAPSGLTIGGTTGLTPGGACTGDCNLISGNNGDGIEFSFQTLATPVQNPVIRGNYIGTDLAGTADVGNLGAGLRFFGNVDGALMRDNVIAGNNGDGIAMFPGTVGGPSHSTIAANRIGADAQGDAPLPNGGRGIRLDATVTMNQGPMAGNVIGGTADPTPGGICDGDCNVISGNALDGMLIFRSSGGPISGTQVLGNHIGANAAGTGAVPNSQWGFVLGGGSGAQVGSTAAPNVISGNGISGVMLQPNTNSGNTIEANRIGTTANGAGALGNTDSGVEVAAGGNGATVGGTAAGAGNTIANNGDAGVSVHGLGTPTARVPILGNSIRDNAGLGIDLMPDALTFGVTPNDGPGDPDDGGNEFLNFPVLDTVAVVGSETWVFGSLDSVASTTYRIELFANSSPDPSGNGEGAEFAGTFDVTTDSTGHADFIKSFAGTTAAGKSITATATRLDGSHNPVETSEFSANLAEGCDLTGTAGADTLIGTAASEVICGLGGNDVIVGGAGDDVIVGGDGTDTAAYTGAASAVTVDLPAGTATGGAGSDSLRDVESATGSSFGDQLTALATGSALNGMAGADTLSGGAGPDSLVGDDGNDTLNGGPGADQIAGGGGVDTGAGGEGNDTVAGGGGNDSLDGGNGADTVNGDDDDDALTGGSAADQLNGGGGNDILASGDGDDTMSGSDGDDVLSGGAGNDAADGGVGNDTLGGEDGDDTLDGLDGNDSLTGGLGNDVIDGGVGDDSATGDDGDDTLLGQGGDDALTGGTGADSVQSQGGRDSAEGNGGEDLVKAGGGDKDQARGGGGDDTVKGGGGKKDDVRGGGGKDQLDGGGGDKDECDGGGGKDRKPAHGCEKEKSIP